MDSLQPTCLIRSLGGCRRRGFSLIEVVIVVLIVGIVSVATAPTFHRFLQQHAVEAAARRIQIDLKQARARAHLKSSTQEIRFVRNPPGYTLPGVPHPDHPGQDYSVKLDAFPYGVQLASVDFAGNEEVSFDMNGIPLAGGEVIVSLGNHVRTVQVDANSGKATIQ